MHFEFWFFNIVFDQKMRVCFYVLFQDTFYDLLNEIYIYHILVDILFQKNCIILQTCFEFYHASDTLFLRTRETSFCINCFYSFNLDKWNMMKITQSTLIVMFLMILLLIFLSEPFKSKNSFEYFEYKSTIKEFIILHILYTNLFLFFYQPPTNVRQS